MAFAYICGVISLDDILNPAIPFHEKEAAIWNYQCAENPVLKDFADKLSATNPIYLPVRFFRDFSVQSGEWEPEIIFETSGTTGSLPGKHYLRSLADYRKISLSIFHHCYSSKARSIFALLPGYLERPNSSLVMMMKFFIEEWGLPGSGFYLRNTEELKIALCEAMERGEEVLLVGVTHALMDFAEQFPMTLAPETIVMETGGMKGRKKEMVREEVHEVLRKAWGLENIHSEYGMTEMLSQGYAKKQGRFHFPHWVKVTITDPYLPTRELKAGQPGRIAITDLANLNTCAFILTDDIGKLHPDGSLEVLGRLDYAEMRGCNLLYDTSF